MSQRELPRQGEVPPGKVRRADGIVRSERDERIRLTAIYSKVRDTIEDALHAGMAEDDAHLAVHAAIDASYEVPR